MTQSTFLLIYQCCHSTCCYFASHTHTHNTKAKVFVVVIFFDTLTRINLSTMGQTCVTTINDFDVRESQESAAISASAPANDSRGNTSPSDEPPSLALRFEGGRGGVDMLHPTTTTTTTSRPQPNPLTLFSSALVSPREVPLQLPSDDVQSAIAPDTPKHSSSSSDDKNDVVIIVPHVSHEPKDDRQRLPPPRSSFMHFLLEEPSDVDKRDDEDGEVDTCDDMKMNTSFDDEGNVVDVCHRGSSSSSLIGITQQRKSIGSGDGNFISIFESASSSESHHQMIRSSGGGGGGYRHQVRSNSSVVQFSDVITILSDEPQRRPADYDEANRNGRSCSSSSLSSSQYEQQQQRLDFSVERTHRSQRATPLRCMPGYVHIPKVDNDHDDVDDASQSETAMVL